MFTGIVEEVGKVISAQPRKLTISANKTIRDMEPGASIAVNGVCLTITSPDTDSVSVDVMPETMSRTNLSLLKTGDRVNLERPMALGGRLGGHLVQGHIDGTGKIISLTPQGGATIVKLEAPLDIMRYIVEKGFIAIDGMSLTVVGRDSRSFLVSIVNYTWQNTNLSSRVAGDAVNLEVDIIAKYVEQLSQPRSNGITFDFLKEHGFSGR